MASYTYRLPRHYRYRAAGKSNSRGSLVALVVFAVLAASAGTKAAAGHHAAPARGVAAEAIAYARAQLGKPYQWDGTGPGAFDCSGLVMEAYAHAGRGIARTSQAQWATERHVSSPRPGDLAFFAGADGTMTSPGHVGIVIGGGRMIEAYATGYPIRIASYDRPDLVGFSQPWTAGDPPPPAGGVPIRAGR